jgi:hypothetical protein
MFGKLGTKRLLIIVLVLAGAWWAFDHFSGSGRERSFKESLLQVDTTAITAFRFEYAPKKHGPAMLFKPDGDHWTITVNDRTVDVDPARIHELFILLHDLRTMSVVGQWSAVKDRYDLSDSLADRLVIDMAQGRHELFIGRPLYGNDEGTAVRLVGDDRVYKVIGKLGEWVEQPPDRWLAKYIITGDANNWTRLRFTFPTDTGYTMMNVDGNWSIDGVPCDTARVWPYLHSLSRAVGQTVLPISDTIGARRAFQLEITDRTRREPLVVTVLSKPDHFVVISSLNPSVAMPFDGQREVPRMFRPRGVFLKRE